MAIITVESRQAFLDAFAAPEGHDDQGSFNEGAPSSVVLCGQPIVHMSEGVRLT